jgi:hypothetical protein
MDTSITHIRPRFHITVPHKQSEVMDRLKEMVQNTPDNLKIKIVDNHIILDIVGEDVHYWSPHLNFRVEKDEENEDQCFVVGIIGPRPPVLTLFMFIYFATGVIGFFISSYGVSKMLLDEYSKTIWAFPVAILFMLTAYRAGKYGEQLGKDQIELMKQFIRDVIYY